ncbi:MAG TPA: GNAT family N-acetyltransferase [Methylomirabilota bacterium]|nr:GNAT family N-acetyltransferase [Methylomirabilota bacterium]
MNGSFEIKRDDLSGPAIGRLLEEHRRGLAAVSPPESMHVLDLDALRQPCITFWSVWHEGELVGCGALKELDAQHGEIKSMRTASGHLRKGVASCVLQHIINEAKRRGYQRLNLETGSSRDFAAAHALYRKFGFHECGPFGDYRLDPNSIFLTRAL